jgi:hypothetical protein
MSPELRTEQPQPGCRETAEKPDTESDDFISATALMQATRILLAYFAARLVFFALNISAYVPPDEVTHAGLCKIFSKVFLLPDNSPETWQFGLVTHIPWLYYWTMGKLLHLNIFGLPELVFLRLLNIPLAFVTVWYAVRLLRLLTASRLTQLLLVVVMTNTPMFSFLSATVSYDNLTNLLAAMAIYYQFAFFRDRSAGLLAASLICQLGGSLTKVTFLPLVLILNVLLFLHEWKRLRAIPASVAAYFRASARHAWLATLLLLVGTGLNLHLYAGNYLRYGTLNPQMSQVLSPAAAMNYRLDERGTIFIQFKEGKISYMDALILAGEIKHPGDKADTFYLLMNYNKMKNNPQLWMGPLAYAKVWFQLMLATTIGIKAHLQMYKGTAYMVPVYAVLGLAVLGFLVRWRPGKSGWLPISLATIALFYAGYLMYEFNYDSYLTYGEPSLTVYGRYLFPIFVPVYVLVCRYLVALSRYGPIRSGLALATALLLISYDFPWFLMHASPEWFSWMPK